MSDKIMQTIKSLPPLPKTILDIQRLSANPDASIGDLVKIISKDPMIVADLLKAANSPLYNFSREIKNIAQVVSLFGMSMTRSIALGHAMKKLMDIDMAAYGISNDRFSEISILQSKFTVAWYKKIAPEKADIIFLASFLQEMGKIVIAQELKSIGKEEAFLEDLKSSGDVISLEQQYLKMTTADLTSTIFEHWNLDQTMIDMIKYSDNPSSIPPEVSLSIKQDAQTLNIVKTIIPVHAPFSDIAMESAQVKIKEFGCDSGIIEDIIITIQQLDKA
jgi:HD-like signal output (HDOD) protein